MKNTIKQLVETLESLHRAYVNTLENGRDRIIALGGQCDDVATMERSDPYLAAATKAIAAGRAALDTLAWHPPHIDAFEREVLDMVLGDIDICIAESGIDYDFKDLSTETVEALGEVIARRSRAALEAPEPQAQGAPTTEWIDKVMEQAQVFASAWSLVGGRFDSGNGLDDASAAKAELRTMLAAAQLPESWRDHVEQRIRTWRHRTMNESGDLLAIDDFMDQVSLDDFVDFVCDEYAHPAPAAPAPQLHSVSSIDVERMLTECVPGGSICDPQQVADAIRNYCNAWEPAAPTPLSGKYGEVLAPFVALMDTELHANSSKGDRPGWLAMSPEIALLEIYWHTAKLSAAVKNDDVERIKEHSADVANMAMMLLDVCGGLDIGASMP